MPSEFTALEQQLGEVKEITDNEAHYVRRAIRRYAKHNVEVGQQQETAEELYDALGVNE